MEAERIITVTAPKRRGTRMGMLIATLHLGVTPKENVPPGKIVSLTARFYS
jgi:hypothetical protein